MKKILVKTQSDLHNLPESFKEFTIIEIRAVETIYVNQTLENSRVVARGNSRVVARGNSRVQAWENSRVEACENSSVEAWGNSRVEAWGYSSVVAWGNSRVVARGNSSVEAWENSSVEAWENSSVEARGNSRVVAFFCATVFVYSISVLIKNLLDNSHLIYKKEGCQRPEQVDSTVKITEFNELVSPTFEQWLERGYVVADGIMQELVSKKTIGDVTIFEVTDSFEKKESFVAKKGDKFAHGNTIEEAKNDLRYKISERDTSKYSSWDIDEIRNIDEMIEAYMTITGACSFGTKQFCDSVKLKDHYTAKEVIELTRGQYGNDIFEKFWRV